MHSSSKIASKTIILGSSLTPSENIRLHRGAAGKIQIVPANDTTPEGSLSVNLVDFECNNIQVKGTETVVNVVSTNDINVSGSITATNGLSVSGAVNFSGATSAIGIVPLGTVLATFPNLYGAYNCTATTVADSNGFVVCSGQTITDVSSPMYTVSGTIIPNINNEVFLMGHTTSGTLGGSNTLLDHTHTSSLTAAGQTASGDSVLVSNESASHTHPMDHSHTGSVAGAGTHNHTIVDPGHTHTIANGALGGAVLGVSATAGTASGGTAISSVTNVTVSGNMGSHSHTVTVDSTTGLSTTANGSNHNHTVSIAHTHGSSSVSGTIGTGSIPGSTNIRPSYISTKYIMRIK